MSSLDPHGIAYVKSEILGYLQRRKYAMDTLKGIVDWWILDQRLRLGGTVVQQAINELVLSKQLEEISSNGKIYYSAVQSDSATPSAQLTEE